MRAARTSRPDTEVCILADCIFCKIVERAIPAKIAMEDEQIIAFHDIAPQAPVHIQFIPKRHVATIDELEDPALLAHLVFAARDHARKLGVTEAGYRLIMNCNPDGGQTVYHLHLHLLAGRQMRALG